MGDGIELKTLFAPGCALNGYKPGSIEKIRRFLLQKGIIDDMYLTCCKESQGSDEKMTIIVCCPGCGHKFGALFPNASVISLWKILNDTDFPFPDYRGERMSIHDSCRSRQRYSEEMQESSRQLCRRMNITLVEPEHTRGTTVCCGGCVPDKDLRMEKARSRAEEFSEKNVVTYCTGCVRSFSVTDKQPRHMLDLLLGEPTEGLTLK